jgi:acetyl esterase
MKSPPHRFLWLGLVLVAIQPGLVAAEKKLPLPEAERRWAAYERFFQDFAKKDREQPPRQGEILFVGSSIFRRWEWVDKQMAPLPVLNRAFGGSRTSDQLARFEQVVPPYAPKVIVYYCGSNDIKVRLAPEIAANFRAFVERVHAGLPRTRILYASILRAPQKQERWDEVEAANKLIRDYCATDPRLGFIDINPAVFDQNGRPRLELYLEDKLHYLPPAYDGFAAIIKPVLERTWREVNAEARAGGAVEAGADVPPGKAYVYKVTAGQPQTLEVYFPEQRHPGAGRVPGLLLFHGGGWSRGSLVQFRAACRYFASRGLVAATADYFVHPKEAVPGLPAGESYKRACVVDAKSAVRWMKQHAAELGLDPQRLIVGGGSAGGHISVLATTNPGLGDPRDPPGIDTSVAAYVLFNPAFTTNDSDTAVQALAHLRPDFAPAIVFFGSEDRWKAGWNDVHRQLRELGGTGTELWVAPGQIHGFYLEQPWRDRTWIAVDRFLARHGFLQGMPTLATPAGGPSLTKVP